MRKTDRGLVRNTYSTVDRMTEFVTMRHASVRKVVSAGPPNDPVLLPKFLADIFKNVRWHANGRGVDRCAKADLRQATGFEYPLLIAGKAFYLRFDRLTQGFGDCMINFIQWAVEFPTVICRPAQSRSTRSSMVASMKRDCRRTDDGWSVPIRKKLLKSCRTD